MDRVPDVLLHVNVLLYVDAFFTESRLLCKVLRVADTAGLTFNQKY